MRPRTTLLVRRLRAAMEALMGWTTESLVVTHRLMIVPASAR
jgi:hypothetical protein